MNRIAKHGECGLVKPKNAGTIMYFGTNDHFRLQITGGASYWGGKRHHERRLDRRMTRRLVFQQILDQPVKGRI